MKDLVIILLGLFVLIAVVASGNVVIIGAVIIAWSGGLDRIRTYVPSDTSIQGKIKNNCLYLKYVYIVRKKGGDDDCVY